MGKGEYDKGAGEVTTDTVIRRHRMKPITRLFTKNLQRVPLLRIDFNLQKFRERGNKNSCMCIIHPVLKDDETIRATMYALCDYIRENYDMEKLV